MPKLHDALLVSIASLAKQRIPSSRLDAELLLAHVLGTSRSWLHAHGEEKLGREEVRKFESLIQRRLKREPVAYITGTKEFYCREFIVNPDVLIPRPETEDLVELALQKGKVTIKVIDIGCGSGCIGITLKLERPEWTVSLSDVSKKALVVAKQNANNLMATVELVQSNLLTSVPKGSTYDLIIANLPYVDTAWETSPETAHEPALALYADQNGLALIFQLIKQSSVALRRFGYLLLEADPEQHHAIIEYASKYDFVHKEIRGYALSLMKQPQA
jgi:release factor glutamine methyltransferase